MEAEGGVSRILKTFRLLLDIYWEHKGEEVRAVYRIICLEEWV